LLEHFLPLATNKVPDALLGQMLGPPTEAQVRGWLDDELSAVFPDPDDLVSEMTLEVQFRNVTWETLNQEGFGDKLCAAYPKVAWGKPFAFRGGKGTRGPFGATEGGGRALKKSSAAPGRIPSLVPRADFGGSIRLRRPAAACGRTRKGAVRERLKPHRWRCRY